MPESPINTRPRSNPAAKFQAAEAAAGFADYPAARQSSQELSFLNPGPKLGMLLAVVTLMTVCSWQIYGFNPRASLAGLAEISAQTDSAAPETALPPLAGNQSGQKPSGPGAAATDEPQLLPPEGPELQAQQEKLARFNKTPRLMSGQTFTSEELHNLSISNSTINKAAFSGCFALNAAIHKIQFKDCVFTDTDFTRANIREAIFENCTFENTRFDESVLFNVSFINCRFKGTQRENGLSKSRIALSRLYNVTFEKAALENYLLFQNSGRVYFNESDLTGLSIRTNGSNVFFPRLDAAPVQFDLRLANCPGGDFELDVQNLESELRVKGANFENAKMHSFSKIQIEDSSLTGMGYIQAKEWLVVKNSTLCADLAASEGMYLLGNNYIRERSPSQTNAFLKGPEGMYRTTKLRPKNGSLCVVEGGTAGAWLTVYGGDLYISDLKMDLAFFDIDNNTSKKIALNLKDVSIGSGHLYSALDEAYWENVVIENTMTERGTRDRKSRLINTVNVTLPEGKPWLEGNGYTLVPAEKKSWIKYQLPVLK